MTLAQIIHDLFFDYTLRTVALGSATLGIVSGSLGTFAVLRRQSLLGDAISHAALPGIVLAFMLTHSKAPLVLILGAAVAGWLGTLFIMSIVKNTRIKTDTAMGIVLSVFFGFGLMLLTFVQKMPDATQAGLDKFLFGQSSTLQEKDVITMAIIGLITLTTVMLFWKEFKLISFDPGFSHSLGMPVQRLEIVMTSLLVVAIVIGLQTVGVVLMSTMIVAPAAAARQWTDRLGLMIFFAGLFGAISGIIGAIISSVTARMPTGPTIVLTISALVLISMLFAPNRGLVWKKIRDSIYHRRLQLEAVLSDLYLLATQHENPQHPHEISTLMTMAMGHGGVKGSLRELDRKGWVKQVDGNRWAFTDEGWQEAQTRNIKARQQS
ncbi:metal ABC transporter permease [bacterium]|nr:metal ABC transporter permease [bacterium]MBU1880465.1 metal ABC transporter permease [bacterium]